MEKEILLHRKWIKNRTKHSTFICIAQYIDSVGRYVNIL